MVYVSQSKSDRSSCIFHRTNNPTCKMDQCISFCKILQVSFATTIGEKGFTDYYIPAVDVVNITKNEIQRYKRKQWTSFAQFKDLQFGIWNVTFTKHWIGMGKWILQLSKFFEGIYL